jgi:hypothetical protein
VTGLEEGALDEVAAGEELTILGADVDLAEEDLATVVVEPRLIGLLHMSEGQ